MDKKAVLSELTVDGMWIKCKVRDLHHHIKAWALLKDVGNDTSRIDKKQTVRVYLGMIKQLNLMIVY